MNVETVARAPNGSGSVVSTEPTYNTRVDAVTISDLHEVIATRMMYLQTQHHKPVGMKTDMNEISKQTQSSTLATAAITPSRLMRAPVLSGSAAPAANAVVMLQSTHKENRQWTVTIDSNYSNSCRK